MPDAQKPLSQRPAGYLIAIVAGTPGLPLGWVLSPLVLLILNKIIPTSDKKIANRFAWWTAAGVLGLPLCWSSWIALGVILNESLLVSCNNGSKSSCQQLLDIDYTHSRIKNPVFAKLQREAAALKEQEAQLARQQAEEAKREEARQKFLAWAKSGKPFAGCQVELDKKLRDPSSYQDDFAMPSPVIDESKQSVSFVWQFRSKNGFGGYVSAAAACVTKPDTTATQWGGFGDPSVSVVQE